MSSRILALETLIETLVSVIVGVVAWLLTGDAVLSFLTGLVSISMTLSLAVRINQEGSKKLLLDTLSLSEEVAFSKELRSLVSDYSNISSQDIELFRSRAREVISETAEIMSGLKSGHMTVRGLLPAYLKGNAIIQTLQKGGIASAIINKPDDWASGEINLYHKINLQMAKAGLGITRVFIVKSDEYLAQNSPLFNTIKEQHEAGIKVYYVRFDELEPSLIRDVGLWDERLVVNMFYSSTGSLDVVTYDTSPTTTRETKEYFERLISRSHPSSVLFDTTHSKPLKKTKQTT